RATMAATRATIDSAASDSRPAELVMARAPPLSSTVSTAVTMASQAYFLRWEVASGGLSWGFMATIARRACEPGHPKLVVARLPGRPEFSCDPYVNVAIEAWAGRFSRDGGCPRWSWLATRPTSRAARR